MIAPLWLVGAFCVVAAGYAAVGLGGATAYAALFSLTAVPFGQIPPLVLTLNLLVAGTAFWGRRRARLAPNAILLPLSLGSMPAAILGGLIPLRERQFLLVLAFALLLAGVRFLLGPQLDRKRAPSRAPEGAGRTISLVLVGAGLGLLAGMTGIGGGVYLGPFLLLTGWGDLLTTPGVTSGFVFLNSAAALGPHLTRVHPIPGLWVPLVLAVLVGGLAGVTVSSSRLSTAWTQRALGLVLVAAAVLDGVKAL